MKSDGNGWDIPVLKPDLDGSLRHVDFLGNTFTNIGSRCGILVELDLERGQLVLGGTLSLLVLLLLGEGALARGSLGEAGGGLATGRGRGRRGLLGRGAVDGAGSGGGAGARGLRRLVHRHH